MTPASVFPEPAPIEFHQVSLIPLDEVNPDLLRSHIDAAIQALEKRSEAELVAMNWDTLQIRTQRRISRVFKGENHLAVIAVVQALP